MGRVAPQQSRQGRNWDEYSTLKPSEVEYCIFTEKRVVQRGDVLNPDTTKGGSVAIARDMMKRNRGNE